MTTNDFTADLMQALINKLYATITGNDENVKIPRNKFVTWLLPGIPFTTEDFTFCSKGLGAGSTPDEDKQMYQQAFYLSKLFDFIPEINDPLVYTGKLEQTIFSSNQDTISSVYHDILKYSQVVDVEIDPKQKEKIQKFRDLMTVTKEVEDIITGDMKQVTQPGPITIAYETRMKEYIDAVDEYMDLLIAAQGATGNDPEGKMRVAAWANKAPILRKKVNAAYNAWISQGYKNEYEDMNAFINQITQRSMVLYKQDLQEKFERSKLSNPGAGDAGDFFYTTLLPGNFATGSGWTEFTFYENDVKEHSDKRSGQDSSGFSKDNFREVGSSKESSSMDSSSMDSSSNSRFSNFSNKESSSSNYSGKSKSLGILKTVGPAIGSVIGGPAGMAIGSVAGNVLGGIGSGNSSGSSNYNKENHSSSGAKSYSSDSSRYSSSNDSNSSGSSRTDSISGQTDSSFETVNINNQSKNFKASFKFTQVPICRPFMDPGIFAMRGWRLSKEWFDNFGDKTVSDGTEDSDGRLVAYPISALFIKDVEFTLDEAMKTELLEKTKTNSQDANSTMGWGFMNLSGSSSNRNSSSSSSSNNGQRSDSSSGSSSNYGSKSSSGLFSKSSGSYSSSSNNNSGSESSSDSSSNQSNYSSSNQSSSSSEKDKDSSKDHSSSSRSSDTVNSQLIDTGKGLKIPGMQLVGFINNFVPKCPNTNPDIKEELFV